MEHTEEYVKLENVSKIYGSKEVKIIAVDEISFRIKKGEFVVVVGPSGAGKTTVLNILGGMDKATSGNVWIPAPVSPTSPRVSFVFTFRLMRFTAWTVSSSVWYTISKSLISNNASVMAVLP